MDIDKLKQVIELVKEDLKVLNNAQAFVCSILNRYKNIPIAESLREAIGNVIARNQSPTEISLLNQERCDVSDKYHWNKKSNNSFGKATRIYFLDSILELLDESSTKNLEGIVEVAYQRTKNNLKTI